LCVYLSVPRRVHGPICQHLFYELTCSINHIFLYSFIAALLFGFCLLFQLPIIMSVLNAYKSLVTIPSTSRLYSMSHMRSSCTPEERQRRYEWEDNRQFRIQTDFEYRKRRHEQRAAYNRRYYARPENHDRHLAQQREARAIYRRVKSPYLGPMSVAWAQWLRRYAWVRDELDWRSHVPVYSPVRIERNCERCSFPSTTGAMWWWVSTRIHIASQQDDSTSVSEPQDRLVALRGSI
jgi:hypothetical protein